VSPPHWELLSIAFVVDRFAITTQDCGTINDFNFPLATYFFRSNNSGATLLRFGESHSVYGCWADPHAR